MIRKIAGLFAALLLTCGLLAAVSAPAQAVTYSTPWSCQNYGGVGYAITTCVSIEWRRQTDGAGVYLEGEQHWTSNGCGDLEGSGGKYTDYVVSMQDPQTFQVPHWYNYGDEPCDSYQDIEWRGRDGGGMYVNLNFRARINLATDQLLSWEWYIYPDGSYHLEHKTVRSA